MLSICSANSNTTIRNLLFKILSKFFRQSMNQIMHSAQNGYPKPGSFTCYPGNGNHLLPKYRWISNCAGVRKQNAESLHFNGHFPGGPVLAGTRMSPLWILFELRVTEVVVPTGAIRRAKLQSNHHHQQTNIQLFTSRMTFLSANQQCQSSEGNQSTEGSLLHAFVF